MTRAAAGLALAALATGAAPAAPPGWSAWAVEFRPEYAARAQALIDAAPQRLVAVDDFSLRLDAAGAVVGSPAARPRGAAQRWVTVVNDVVAADGRPLRRKDGALVAALLANDARRGRLVAALADAAARVDDAGLDLDFEDVPAASRERFTTFVAELARALHARGRRLAVTVQPQLRPETRDGPGAQDLAALANVADELRVMAYHVHHDGTEPGPSAPWDWLGALLEHLRRELPDGRVLVALYGGGWKWQDGRAVQIDHAQARALAATLGAPVQWSAEEHQPYLAHDGVEAWFEDRCSLAEKQARVVAAGLAGVVLWHLGNVDPGLFDGDAGRDCPRVG